MTLVMAKYHFNIHGISPDDLSRALDYIKDLDHESNLKPCFQRYGDCFSDSELLLCLRSLPENVSYIVRRSLDRSSVPCRSMYTVYIMPLSFSTVVIESLITACFVDPGLSSRDVGYNSYRDAINDLPYNYHYIVQRYYE